VTEWRTAAGGQAVDKEAGEGDNPVGTVAFQTCSCLATFPAARKRGLFSSGRKAVSGRRSAVVILLDFGSGQGVE
jgi:hypothetical protein